MSKINNRIAELRKAVGLSMEAFGDKIGVTKSSINALEKGVNNPSEQTIKLIVKEFKVNPEWLRYGEGEMFREMSFEEELAEYFGEVITNTSDSSKEFQRRLIHALSKLDDTDWKVLEKIADQLLEKNKKQPG